MKRDKEWFIKELIGHEIGDYGNYYNGGYEDGLAYALKLAHQLDEPEVTLDRAFEKIAESYPMTKEEVWRHLELLGAYGGEVIYGEPEILSKEWIDNNSINASHDGVTDEYVHVDDLKNLLVPKQEITFDQVHDKLREESILSEKSFDYYWNCINDDVEIDELVNLLVPKKELPVIPKFVAEWITNHREKYGLYPALKRLEGNPFGWERIYTWYRTNPHDFVNAYLTGEYEVEGEPLYCVEDGKHTLLCKWESSDGWKVISTVEATEDGLHTDTLVFELTEQEIKDFDPRYWAFRKPV